MGGRQTERELYQSGISSPILFRSLLVLLCVAPSTLVPLDCFCYPVLTATVPRARGKSDHMCDILSVIFAAIANSSEEEENNQRCIRQSDLLAAHTFVVCFFST